MNRDEKHIARIMFKNKIYESDGQAYEDLLVRVMQNVDENFEPVKPQGSYGDRKNDGFIRDKGIFFQVYAPENLRFKESEAIDKLNEDFSGIIKHWKDQGYEINEFNYAVNDKYKGSYPTLIKAINEIQKTHGIKTRLYRNKHLEEAFLSLQEDKILDIIGFLPDPDRIENLDFNIMNQVVNFLLSSEATFKQEAIPDNPDFDEKIEFNSLSKQVKSYLDYARFQRYQIDEYFEFNSNFEREELRLRFNELYREALIKIPEGETQSDEIFFHIAEKAAPKNTQAILNAVFILMAYYFEYCDIFEAPIQ